MLAFHRRRGILRLITLALAATQLSSAFASVRDPFPAVRRAQVTRAPNQLQQKAMPLFLSHETLPEVEKPVTLTSVSGDDDQGTEKQKLKSEVAVFFLSGLGTLAIAAKTGILNGPLDIATGQYDVYTDAMIFRDTGSTVFAAALAYVLVKLITLGYEKGVYDSKVARKLSHTLSAPLYMLLFPIFSEADGARFFAELVTLVNAIRLYLAGTGRDTSLANAVSRSGDKSEALGGPFIYVCFFQVFLLLFWRTSMVGIIAMSTMAAGDGMADLVGRRWGRNNKWFFSEDKSIVGTAAFAVASSLTSIGLVNWLMYTGCLQSSMEPMDLALRIIAISVACSLVELLPVGDDNYSVPLSAAALAALLLH
jgi:dolichol kinase